MALGQIPVSGSGVSQPRSSASSFVPANPLAPIPTLAQLPLAAAIGTTQYTSDQSLVMWNGSAWVQATIPAANVGLALALFADLSDTTNATTWTGDTLTISNLQAINLTAAGIA